MIRICDRTLSSIDDFSPTKGQLTALITRLFQCDADCVEISPKMFDILGNLPQFGSYLLRLERPEDADRYPMFDKFICERSSDDMRHVYAEIHVNDTRDSSLIMRHQHDKILRLSGLDGLMRQNVATSLETLKNFLPKNTEFCPGNSLDSAVAAAMEWINAGCGNTLVTAFGGIGGAAPFEEILLALRHTFRRHPLTNYEFLPTLRDIMTEITGKEYGVCTPVTGQGIFTVESGIHIGGILKHPKCYEPFPPETVGGKRVFIYGKFSGSGAVRHELLEMGITVSHAQLERITKKVKDFSVMTNRPVTDDELLGIAKSVCGGGDGDEG